MNTFFTVPCPPEEARWLRAETAREGGRGKPRKTQKGKERIALMLHRFGQGTWLQPEEAAYPHGRMTRRGLAKWPDGKFRRVWAGLPDTFYTIPAYGRVRGKRVTGFLTVDDGVLIFNYEEEA